MNDSTSKAPRSSSVFARSARSLGLLLALAAAAAPLAGCDLLDEPGAGSVALDAPAGPFAGGYATMTASYELVEVDAWSPSYRIDGGPELSPDLGYDEVTGARWLEMTFDTAELGVGQHTLEVILRVDGDDVSDSATFEIVDGVMVKDLAAATVGWDGDYGGDPEPEIHLFDASNDGWLGCARAAGGLALRTWDGAPLPRPALEGHSVYVVYIENDGSDPCAPPSFVDDIFGQGDDFLGQSDAFVLDGEVTVEAGAGNRITIGFGLGA